MIALIDADILLFKFAHRNEDETEWEEGVVSHTMEVEEAKREVDEFVVDLKKRLKVSEVLMVFSGRNNFRYKVEPTYKWNRPKKKPYLLIPIIRKYITETYETKVIEGIEGDDTMGVLATMFKGEYIICSIDKDMKQVPVMHYNWDKDELVTVTPEEGHRFFLRQILTGDSTDGYSGCPKCGPDKANKFLDDPYILVPYEHTFKRGKRVGETEIRYTKEPTDDIWRGMVSLYEQQGLDEEHAIRQARLARILQAQDYDFIKEEPILWEPKNIWRY